MYRNKMMIIATVLVTGLLGVMIWSSHVIADNHAKKNQPVAEEMQNKNIQDEEVEESSPRFEETAPPPQREKLVPQTDLEQPLVIDTSVIEPQILERLKSGNRIEKNYLDKLNGMKKVVLWNTTTFPLKVYIADEANLPSGFADGIKTAFTNWQNASKQFVSFDFVGDEASADIVVKVPDDAKDCSEEDGITREIIIANNRIQHAYLTVSKNDCDGNERNIAQLYTTIQHHVGHLLGIDGHSAHTADAMYSEQTYENINISDIDVHTLKYLYSFSPDITNKPYTAPELRKKLKFSNIRSKNSQEINDYLKANLLSDEAKATPMEKALETGLRYLDQSNYRMALTYLKNALDKTEDKFDKAYIYRAIAITYLRTGEPKNLQNALDNANAAYNITNSPTNDYLLAYLEYRMDNEEACLTRLDRIMHDYPRLKSSYSLAAQIYDKKGDKDKLREISKNARENFFENPPVVLNEE